LFKLYGVDPIRLWAAKKAGGNHDIVVKHSEFKSSINEAISKIRNTFKYLIGALADHDAVDDKLDHTKLTTFDQYYLNKLYRFASTIDEHYKNYRYDSVADEISRFITDDFSPTYITTIKDILLFIKIISSKIGNMRDSDIVLYIDDKKLYKSLSKLCNSEPELMMELFRISTFNITFKDKLDAPEGEELFAESNSDDSLKLISAWSRGGQVMIKHNNKPIRFEFSYDKTMNRKCIRCRRYRIISEHVNVCDRCAAPNQ
jgi:hypothetical protein